MKQKPFLDYVTCSTTILTACICIRQVGNIIREAIRDMAETIPRRGVPVKRWVRVLRRHSTCRRGRTGSTKVTQQ